MTERLLTEADLVELTGVRQGAAQVRFLQKWGIAHVVKGNGRPAVTWDQVNKVDRQRSRPNFGALRQPA